MTTDIPTLINNMKKLLPGSSATAAEIVRQGIAALEAQSTEKKQWYDLAQMLMQRAADQDAVIREALAACDTRLTVVRAILERALAGRW